MRRVKLLGSAIIAVFALSAVMASWAAAEPPELLPVKSTFTIKSGAGELVRLNGEAVKCTGDKSLGTVEAETTKLTNKIHIDFEGCAASGVKCSSEGQAAGVILVLGVGHWRYWKMTTPDGSLVVELLFLLEHVSFKCSALVTIEVLGSLPCTATPLKAKVKTTEHFIVQCTKTAANDQEVTEVYTEEAVGGALSTTKEAVGLVASKNGGGFEMAAELTTEELTPTIGEPELMG